MNFLNVCFFGYGSIAKRHIDNLVTLCSKRKIKLNIDLVRHKKNKEKIRYINNVYEKRINTADKYDIIFITNPTSFHYKTLKANIHNANLFFVEKPLVGYHDINKVNKLEIDFNKVYVACPLRYKKIMMYLMRIVNKEKIFCARAICSSYLPEWRKEYNYMNSYSAQAKLGGGVRLDLIHEFDYLKLLFGKPNKIKYCYSKISNLNIDSEDIATYIAEYKDRIVELHIDYFGRVYQRKIELWTNDDVIVADLYNNRISFLKSKKVIQFKEVINDFYLKELNSFLDIYFKKVDNKNNIKSAIETIELTRGKVQ